FLAVAGQLEMNLLLFEPLPRAPAPPGVGDWALRFLPSTGRGLPCPRHQIEVGKTRPRFCRCIAPGTTRHPANEAPTALPLPRPGPSRLLLAGHSQTAAFQSPGRPRTRHR